MALVSFVPRTVKEIFRDYIARCTGIIRALTDDVDEFFTVCDPDKENLCLYGHPNESWEVNLPAVEVPPELPEPIIGINFARDGMRERDWLFLIAVHSDSWLLSVAFYFGAELNRNERKRLFSMINDLPTVPEVVSEWRPAKNKPNTYIKSLEEDEEGETVECGSCCGKYRIDEFWILCDICERWYHGQCVKVTPAEGETIKQYKCPSCIKVRRSRLSDGQDKSTTDESLEEDEDGETVECGSCDGMYRIDEFWILCDICERWYHGQCVKVTPAEGETIKHYKCPSCIKVRRS